MCEKDLDCDLLIVIGTSLSVDGVKKIVKTFCKGPNSEGTVCSKKNCVFFWTKSQNDMILKKLWWYLIKYWLLIFFLIFLILISVVKNQK